MFSYNTQTTTEDELSGEEILTDKGCDVAGEVIEKLYLMELQNALSQLNEKERQISRYCMVKQVHLRLSVRQNSAVRNRTYII